MKLGINPGNSPHLVTDFEAVIGRKVDYILAHGGHRDRGDMTGSLGYVNNNLVKPMRQARPGLGVWWSPKLMHSGGSMSSAAGGGFNDVYRAQAKVILAADNASLIYVRVGQEANGTWNSWDYDKGVEHFKNAFRRCADAFRDEAKKAGRAGVFRFEWNNANTGHWAGNLADAYPGDDLVDVIGLTLYVQSTHETETKDPVRAWQKNLTRKVGLQWVKDYAAQRGKKWAITEWGVRDPGFGFFLDQFANFCKHPDCLVQAYWGTSGGYPGVQGYTLNKSEFRSAFQNWPGAAAPPPPPPPVLGFDLSYVDADLHQPIGPLGQDAVLEPHANATIELTPSAPVSKVRLTLKDEARGVTASRVESVPPYVLHGDNTAGQYFGGPFDPGAYTFTGELLDQAGQVLYAQTLTFRVAEAATDCEAELARCNAELEGALGRLAVAEARLGKLRGALERLANEARAAIDG